MSAAAAERRGPRWWFIVFVLLCLAIALDGAGLLRMPIFGDEGIYLRWAQLIRQHPIRQMWIALVDPKPPLHFWLLAAATSLTKNPLAGARMVSLLAGLAAVPGMLLLYGQLAELLVGKTRRGGRESAAAPAAESAEMPTGAALGLIATVLLVFCPFIGFYERLATADMLFVTEMIYAAWLSVRLARAAVRPGAEAAGARGVWRYGLPLGAVIGLAMLTRQIVSYELWALPVVAWVVMPRCKAPGFARGPNEGGDRHDERPPGRAGGFFGRGFSGRGFSGWGTRRFVAWMVAAALLGGVMFAPFLAAQPVRYHVDGAADKPVTAASVSNELRRRILYQSQFAEGGGLAARARQIAENTLRVFVPGRWVTPAQAGGHAIALAVRAPTRADRVWIPQWTSVQMDAGAVPRTAETGWLWFYMTPPLLIMSLVGFVWMALRRQWRLLAFVGVWAGLMIGPIIVFGAVSYSRYVLSAVPPLLLAAAFVATDWLGGLLENAKCGMRNAEWNAARPPARSAWRMGYCACRVLACVGIAVLALGLLAWPAHDLALQAGNYEQQPLVERDVYQYVTGWTAGSATAQAIRYLQDELPARSPLVIITTNAWGNPADAIWAYVSEEPYRTVYYTDALGRRALKEATRPGAAVYRLRADKWLYTRPVQVNVPPDVPVVLVVADPVYTADGPVPAGTLVRQYDPQAELEAAFANPAPPSGAPMRPQDRDRVLIFRMQ